VVDKGFGELLETLDALPAAAATVSIEQRPAFIVDAVWQAFSSPTSMAALEILIATRGARTSSANAHLAAMTKRLNEIGQHLGAELPPSRAGRLGNLIWATVRGLVAVQLTWPEPLDSTRDREMLVEVVTTYLADQRSQDRRNHRA
jgi:hypothetical protein